MDLDAADARTMLHAVDPPPRIGDGGALQKHISDTYFGLRGGMTLIGFSLPVVLILGGVSASPEDGFTCGRVCGSISAYYASGVPLLRDIFVGALIAVAALLISYRGFSEAEDNSLTIAGNLAVVTALIPTPHLLHQLAAVGLFLCMALVCWFRAGDTLPLIRDEKLRRRFAIQYKSQGLMLIGFPATAVVLALTFNRSILILAAETAAIWVFGWYWMTKSRELRTTHAERRAAARELVVMPAGVQVDTPSGSTNPSVHLATKSSVSTTAAAELALASKDQEYRASGSGGALATSDFNQPPSGQSPLRLSRSTRILLGVVAPEFIALAFWLAAMEEGNGVPLTGALFSALIGVAALYGASLGRIPRRFWMG